MESFSFKLQVCKSVSHLDVLINNAGVSNKDHPNEPPSKIKRKEFLQVSAQHLVAPILNPGARDSGTTFSFPKFWTVPGHFRFFYFRFFFSFPNFSRTENILFKKSSFFSGTRNIKVVSFRFQVYPKISSLKKVSFGIFQFLLVFLI